MVSEMIDYVAAAIGIVIIFVGGVFIFGGMLSNGIAYSTQKNDLAHAQSLFDYILLSPGSPSNWGTKAGDPKAFGLATPGTAQPYSLSQASVMRLLESSATFSNRTVSFHGKTYLNLTEGYFSLLIPYGTTLNYTYVKELLNIQGSFEFYLTLQPALNIVIRNVTSSEGLEFAVAVTNFYGSPLADATLNATLIFLGSGSGNKPSLIYITDASSSTNATGVGLLNFNFESDQSPSVYALLVRVTSAGLLGYGYYTSMPPSQLEAYAVVQPGMDNVTLIQHCALITTPSCGVDNFNTTSAVPNGEGGLSTANLSCTSYTLNAGQGGGNQHANSTCVGILNSGFLLVSIKQVGNSGQKSRNILEIFPLNPALGNLEVNFGLNPVTTQSVGAASLNRVVTISGVSYMATFVYWPDQGAVYGGFP